jgi:hypothetical protein
MEATAEWKIALDMFQHIKRRGENSSELVLFKMFYTAICMRKMSKCHSNLT